MITITLVLIAFWWILGIIASILLYKNGKIALADLGFVCFLSIFPGPLAFFELKR
jgi:hypothetical protein